MCKKAGQKKVCCVMVMERRTCSGNAAACRAARLPACVDRITRLGASQGQARWLEIAKPAHTNPSPVK